ncbi:FecCD family ABC transporter permease [Flexivirga alba]|uniref:FecCD family ABC transporter permease n=1 Tax=Flexivirga alba TaxID=702742 RepID=A0ABW2AM83_9MICO
MGSAAVAAPITAGTLVVVGIVSLTIGRYHVPLDDVVQVLIAKLTGTTYGGSPTEYDVVVLVRLPRIILAALIGGGLSVSGVALQATFRNPLVSPQIIGVSSGASFGGALALLLGLGTGYLVGGAFVFGLAALGVVFLMTAGKGGASMLMIVLGGVVTGSFFSALVSLITYLANPYNTLPEIVFWLLGSVATATYSKVLMALVPITAGTMLLLLLRWRINVLSLGDEDAAAVGTNPGPVRWMVLCAVTLIVAGAVAASGIISWVGLVVPHLVRMWVGPDHRALLPVSFFAGAAFLVLIDTLARSMTAAEIPLGVLTAMIGAPVFFVLLRRNRNRIWDHA